MHENREKFAAPESRRARFIHNQTGMRPAEHLAVMQRARTCGSREQLASISLRTMHHDGTMMGNAAFSDRTSQYHCSLSPTRRPLARPAPMATMRGERKGGGTGWPSVLPSAATSRYQKGCRQRTDTRVYASSASTSVKSNYFIAMPSRSRLPRVSAPQPAKWVRTEGTQFCCNASSMLPAIPAPELNQFFFLL